jgi:hypothetical protein
MLQPMEDAVAAQRAIYSEAVAALKRPFEEATRLAKDLVPPPSDSGLERMRDNVKRIREEIEMKITGASESTLNLIRNYKPHKTDPS